MFDFKTTAEIRGVNVRTEYHGDEKVSALDIMLMALDVPIAKLTSVGRLEILYDGDQPALGELNPFNVAHKLENLTVKLGDGAHKVDMKGVTIKRGARLKIKPDRVVDVLLTVQTEHHDQLVLDIMDMLKEEVPVEVQERQLKLADMS